MLLAHAPAGRDRHNGKNEDGQHKLLTYLCFERLARCRNRDSDGDTAQQYVDERRAAVAEVGGCGQRLVRLRL